MVYKFKKENHFYNNRFYKIKINIIYLNIIILNFFYYSCINFKEKFYIQMVEIKYHIF